jgi:uncharacterized membrane protein YgdD (TMEM256/DUF423 family)
VLAGMRLSSAALPPALYLITTMDGRRSPVMTSAWCLRLAAVSGFLVVALGAFGAHSLKPLLQTHQTLDIWEKAVMYHALHTLVLLGLAAQPGIAMGMVVSFLGGMVLFSGSLYLMALTNLRWLGAITPLGGVSFLVGWAWLFVMAGSKPQG